MILHQYIWCSCVLVFSLLFCASSLSSPTTTRHGSPLRNTINTTPLLHRLSYPTGEWEDGSTKRTVASRVTSATPSTTEPSKIVFTHQRAKESITPPRPSCIHSPGHLLMTWVPGFDFHNAIFLSRLPFCKDQQHDHETYHIYLTTAQYPKKTPPAKAQNNHNRLDLLLTFAPKETDIYIFPPFTYSI